jgi:formiminotetrahydrofolate cyclodeaminase
MNEMKHMTLEGFTSELASNSPAPGGGSVAALSLSIGVSLASMVFSLTTGKKIYMAYDDETKKKVDDGILEADGLRKEFLNPTDEDTAAFNELMAAFKLPKESDEEKAYRSAKIQEGYKKATDIPLKVAKMSEPVFKLLEVAAEYGNPQAISDAGVGTLSALTGLEGALLNVRINLPGIKDSEYESFVTNEISRLLETGKAMKEKIMEKVNSKI